ncbi:hypothetical protein Lser_V15G19401 [Lactuca serriola]
MKRIPLFYDSESAIRICHNLVQHSTTKHIALRCHFIKDHVEDMNVEVHFVHSSDQLVDIFTKALQEVSFNEILQGLGMIEADCVLQSTNQLRDYRINMKRIPLFYDSESAIRICHNLVQHSTTKHIALRYHFIKDHVENMNVEVHFVHSSDQLVDIFTKALQEVSFNEILQGLGMIEADCNQLRDYRINMKRIPLFYDSESAIRICHNLVQHSTTKHIALRYHFIKDHVEDMNVEVHFVHSSDQLVDIFTKALQEVSFNEILQGLGMIEADCNQLRDYRINMKRIPLFYDSESAIRICHNLVQHSTTKHIALRYHFIKDHVENMNVEVHFVHSSDQLVDIFTKALQEVSFNEILQGLGMIEADCVLQSTL